MVMWVSGLNRLSAKEVYLISNVRPNRIITESGDITKTKRLVESYRTVASRVLDVSSL